MHDLDHSAPFDDSTFPVGGADDFETFMQDAEDRIASFEVVAPVESALDRTPENEPDWASVLVDDDAQSELDRGEAGYDAALSDERSMGAYRNDAETTYVLDVAERANEIFQTLEHSPDVIDRPFALELPRSEW